MVSSKISFKYHRYITIIAIFIDFFYHYFYTVLYVGDDRCGFEKFWKFDLNKEGENGGTGERFGERLVG